MLNNNISDTDEHSHKMTWRKFQKNLQHNPRRKNSHKSLKNKIFMLFLALCIAAIGFTMKNFLPPFPAAAYSYISKGVTVFKNSVTQTTQFFENITFSPDKTLTGENSGAGQGEEIRATLTKKNVKNIIDDHSLLNTRQDHFTVTKSGHNLTIETTLDMKIQHFILDKLEALKPLDRGKPEIIAMVVMDPRTGRILAMAGFDDVTPDTNPCTEGIYPAASIFKMITASAALETCGYTPGTTLYFNGGKYTLYKRQLKDKHNKYSNKVTFANAFAESINPIFGKLGAIKLGGDILEEYATSFGFNQKIDSDIPFTPGTVLITENAYQWAEVASGFNKTTTISPLFGAMMASTMLNDGNTPVPSVVDVVTNEKGSIVYQRKDEIMGSAIKPETAKAVMAMMNKTISKGTARKSFKGFKKDAILSKMNIGGKTGSLYNRNHTVKFDWFTGFCKDNKGKEQIVVSVVVGHGKYIGIRASRYGRMIFTEYFNKKYALNSTKSSNG